MMTSPFVPKYRKKVAVDTSALAAICSTVVSSNPCSAKSSRAESWMAARVLNFLRVLSPGATDVRAVSSTGGATVVLYRAPSRRQIVREPADPRIGYTS
jgi:hypothetical protein